MGGMPHPLLGIGGPLSTAVIKVPPAPGELLPPLLLLPPLATPLSLLLPPPAELIVDPAVPLEAPPEPGLVPSPPTPVGSTESSPDASLLAALQPAKDRIKAKPSIKKGRMENLVGGWLSKGCPIGRSQSYPWFGLEMSIVPLGMAQQRLRQASAENISPMRRTMVRLQPIASSPTRGL